MIRDKISDRLVETLRQTTHPEAPGLLLLMLSSSPSQRESEFSTFHSTLKDRYGVDSSKAQLVKLYPAPLPLQSKPSRSILTVRCGCQSPQSTCVGVQQTRDAPQFQRVRLQVHAGV